MKLLVCEKGSNVTLKQRGACSLEKKGILIDTFFVIFFIPLLLDKSSTYSFFRGQIFV